VKENSDGNDTNVGSIGNSIEEDIKILEEFKTNGYSILLMKYGDRIKTNFKLAKAIENILSAYKRVLKENERYKKSDYETICLENNELREITDRIQSEYKDLLKDNFKLKNELETKRKEYQETYKDVREELKELRKENEELRAKWDKDTHILQNKLDYANADRIDLAQQNKELRKENEELKNKLSLKQFDVNIVYNDYLEKLNEYERNTIPIQKVKDKIEELDKKVKDYQCVENRINLYQRKVLQELLKESEE
jgi:chromosome segregation ATPase